MKKLSKVMFISALGGAVIVYLCELAGVDFAPTLILCILWGFMVGANA